MPDLGEIVPLGLHWQSLLDRDGDELETTAAYVRDEPVAPRNRYAER